MPCYIYIYISDGIFLIRINALITPKQLQHMSSIVKCISVQYEEHLKKKFLNQINERGKTSKK